MTTWRLYLRNEGRPGFNGIDFIITPCKTAIFWVIEKGKESLT